MPQSVAPAEAGSSHAAAAAVAAAAGGGTGSAAPTPAAAANLAQYAPRIGWDLGLHPPQLEQAYWRERAAKLSQWDYQVNLFLMLMMFTMIFKFAGEGYRWYLLSFGLAWAMCLAWLSAMHARSFYCTHRLAILVGVRLLMAVSSMAATDGVREQLYKSLLFPSPVLTVVLKMFLFCNTGQIVVESTRLQLPLRLQVPLTALKAACLLMGEFTRAFVAFANTRRYLGALDASTSAWSALVRSGAPLTLTASPRLAGRSWVAMEALLILYATDVALVAYMCYISLWSDVRLWLADKMAEAAGVQSDAPAGVVMIEGLAVSREQLAAMVDTPGAALLLRPRGWLGRASQLCLHAAALNVLCLASLVASRLVAQQLLPALLPEDQMGLYYPLLPTHNSTCPPAFYC